MFLKVEDNFGRFQFVNILCVEKMFARTTYDADVQTWNAVVLLKDDSDWYYLARKLDSENHAFDVIQARLANKII